MSPKDTPTAVCEFIVNEVIDKNKLDEDSWDNHIVGYIKDNPDEEIIITLSACRKCGIDVPKAGDHLWIRYDGRFVETIPLEFGNIYSIEYMN